ncbi:MAG: ribbon-helix-helix protein, CopG family [Saprospiraceae bacterium]
MTSISINIEDQLKKQIEAKAAEMKVPTNELILQAIKDFLFFNQLNTLRDKLEEKFKAKGYQNEDDIYNAIS